MARREVTGKKAGRTESTVFETDKTETVERAAYNVREFCIAHRISESFYYKIRKLGLGPREHRTLDKVTITYESAREWREANPVEPTA